MNPVHGSGGTGGLKGVGVASGPHPAGSKLMQPCGGESGVHGGEVWFGAQIGGLIGVCTMHGELTLAGGDSGQPELGLQRRRIAVSISPLRTTTFACCEYESEYRTTDVDASP